jgi:hypothetical protein
VFEDYQQLPLEERFELMKFINQESYLILDHIASKYPQTRSKGVSKRIKSRVPVINNRESNEFNFLLRNNLQITYREDEDYSEDIMRIINRLITFSNEVYDKNMELEDSNFEVFTEIMEYIFENSVLQSAEAVAGEVSNIISSKKNKIDKILERANELGEFDDSVDSRSMDPRQSVRAKDFQKQVQIGHKIPIGVPLFTEEDIQASNFHIKDSSILRLLTKWAEELRDKILNAEDSIYHRRFKFVNNKGKRINLEPGMRQLLYQAAIGQVEVIEK